MGIVSLVADICGILAFAISLFVANKVYHIRKEQNNNKVDVSGTTTIGGDFVGRDKK
jgi:hypothetical protein